VNIYLGGVPTGSEGSEEDSSEEEE